MQVSRFCSRCGRLDVSGFAIQVPRRGIIKLNGSSSGKRHQHQDGNVIPTNVANMGTCIIDSTLNQTRLETQSIRSRVIHMSQITGHHDRLYQTFC